MTSMREHVVPSQRTKATLWLKAAKAAGMHVLLTLDHSQRVIYKHVPGKKKPQPFGQSRVMPTAAQYRKAFLAIRARFPWVTEFATWDETNCYCEVTFNKEALVAKYYEGLSKACSKCTIAASVSARSRATRAEASAFENWTRSTSASGRRASR